MSPVCAPAKAAMLAGPPVAVVGGAAAVAYAGGDVVIAAVVVLVVLVMAGIGVFIVLATQPTWKPPDARKSRRVPSPAGVAGRPSAAVSEPRVARGWHPMIDGTGFVIRQRDNERR
jgi:hypothetical protein